MANTLISYNGKSTYFNDDSTTALYLATNASEIYLNADCSSMFNNCRNITNWSFLNKFNWDNVTNCRNMFRFCNNFNQPITIPNNVIDCSTMFSYCYNFNQPITIPNNVIDCTYIFSSCNNFNQPITIPNNVTNCNGMFFYCSNFNQLITIGNNVTNCGQMFTDCRKFNQPITIPNNVTNCFKMFANCNNFNQNIIVPNNVTDYSYMFSLCSLAEKHIYFKRETISTTLTMVGLLFNKPNNIRTYLHFYQNMNSLFNGMSQGFDPQQGRPIFMSNITGTPSCQWTAMTNGFYNATYNIYCYYNYTG